MMDALEVLLNLDDMVYINSTSYIFSKPDRKKNKEKTLDAAGLSHGSL